MDEKSFRAGSAFPPLKTGLPRLYSMRFCSYAHRTRLLLAHLNIPYETININLSDKPEWFLEKNPWGMVPVLEIDDKIIPESDVCCDFIDEAYNAGLKSKDVDRQKEDKRLVENYSKVTTPYYNALFSMGQDLRSVETYHAGLKSYELALKGRGTTYFGGDSVKLIDFLLYPHMERLILIHKIVPELELSEHKYPLLYAWIRRMQELPAVQKTRHPDDLHVEYLKNYAKGKQLCDMGL